MTLFVATLLAVGVTCTAGAQTSSLGAKKRRADAGKTPKIASREAPHVERNPVYTQFSWVSGPPRKPKTFTIGDLVTVIVRERRQYEADADLSSKKKLNLKSDLNAFIKLTDKGLGSAAFRRGKPSIDYSFDNNLKSEADSEREDSLTFRLTGRIIDVKPNGVLILEAKARVQHDDEVSVVTVTGGCRKEDVTADNTILSTQLVDKTIAVENSGALREATTRGWILRFLELLKPV